MDLKGDIASYEYPLFCIPSKRTNLETQYDVKDNVYIVVRIVVEIEGREFSIYDGFCNIKLVEDYDVKYKPANIEIIVNPAQNAKMQISEVPEPENHHKCPMWTGIDPRSPYVYNGFDRALMQEHYSMCTRTSQITVQEGNTYVQNIYQKAIQYNFNLYDEVVDNRFRHMEGQQWLEQMYEEEENRYECEKIIYHVRECGEIMHNLVESGEIMPEEVVMENWNQEQWYSNLQSEFHECREIMHHSDESEEIMCDSPEEVINENQNQEQWYTNLQSELHACGEIMFNSDESEEIMLQEVVIENQNQEQWYSDLQSELHEYREIMHNSDKSGEIMPEEVVIENQNQEQWYANLQSVLHKCGEIMQNLDESGEIMTEEVVIENENQEQWYPNLQSELHECGEIMHNSESGEIRPEKVVIENENQEQWYPNLQSELHERGEIMHNSVSGERPEKVVIENQNQERLYPNLRSELHECGEMPEKVVIENQNKEQWYPNFQTDLHESGEIMHNSDKSGEIMPEEAVIENQNQEQWYPNFQSELHEGGEIMHNSDASGEIMPDSPDEDENQNQEQWYSNLQREKRALVQLMSPDMLMAKQRKTILYSGEEPENGQTIQRIAYDDDLSMECSYPTEVDHEVVIEQNEDSVIPRQKKYQCAKCYSVFNNISSFNKHVTKPKKCKRDLNFKYICTECGKTFKTEAKFETHCLGHGDPDLECNKCHKVFASKFTLRNHRKIHNRKFPCNYCSRTYATSEELREHNIKKHPKYMYKCETCQFITDQPSELTLHGKVHETVHEDSSETELAESLFDDVSSDVLNDFSNELSSDVLNDFSDEVFNDLSDSVLNDLSDDVNDLSDDVNNLSDDVNNLSDDVNDLSNVSNESDIVVPSPVDPDWKLDSDEESSEDDSSLMEESNKISRDKKKIRRRKMQEDDVSGHDKHDENHDDTSDADSIIAKVMSSNIFLAKKPWKGKNRLPKICIVCEKKFSRISDLKRHLIEHVVRVTLAKGPVNKHGLLNIKCHICKATFQQVDRYKAHLRGHAKLTLYQCTHCDKSFSDSSNFSKHKKVHAATFFQCDMCRRKFNSKKMLIRHMEYHNTHDPIPCTYCDRFFYFESMLNKHVKSAHSKKVRSKFRCRFCPKSCKSLKEKWDHEWIIHKVRKVIVDCSLCDSQFRKYAELKRHCHQKHDYQIPPAKVVLKRK